MLIFRSPYPKTADQARTVPQLPRSQRWEAQKQKEREELEARYFQTVGLKNQVPSEEAPRDGSFFIVGGLF